MNFKKTNFEIINKLYNDNDMIEKIQSFFKNKNKINRDTTNKEIFLNSFINFKSANNNTNNDYLNFYKKF